MASRRGAMGEDGEFATANLIRDAAIARFARDGFQVGLRAIAADAGVTAALIVHYFGSKDGLRRACDAHVLQIVRDTKTKTLTDGSGSTLLAQMARIEEFAPLVRYVLRSMQHGGELAREMVDQMIADADAYLAAGEAAGVIRPSLDRAARTRYLTYQATGGMLLWFSLHGTGTEPEEFAAHLRHYLEELASPALEMFTHGLLADRSMLDEYLLYVPDPPQPDADDAAR